MRKLLILSLTALTASTAGARQLIEDLRAFRDSPGFYRRAGLESELTGITPLETADVLRLAFGGKRERIVNRYPYKDSRGRARVFETTDLWNMGSVIGDLQIKPEDNAPTLDELSEVEHIHVVEIVTRPLVGRQYRLFQYGLDLLRHQGAAGTTPAEAVAFQVNVEMGATAADVDVAHVLATLRNYLRPENRREIERHLKVPEIRRGYVGYPTAGFLRRIFDPDYRPTKWQLYMDAMYRSGLEHVGDERAWSYTDDEARAALRAHVEAHGFEKVLQVFKWNYVRYSSLMMFLFPDEWLTRYLESTDWFKAHPILEFREPNSDFKVVEHVEWILGLVEASRVIGDFTPATLARYRCERALAR